MTDSRITEVLARIDTAVRDAGLVPDGMFITELQAEPLRLTLSLMSSGEDSTRTLVVDINGVRNETGDGLALEGLS
ncbi:MAG: hypothetical protein ACRCZP_11480 [Phycicoccus sp.]